MEMNENMSNKDIENDTNTTKSLENEYKNTKGKDILSLILFFILYVILNRNLITDFENIKFWEKKYFDYFTLFVSIAAINISCFVIFSVIIDWYRRMFFLCSFFIIPIFVASYFLYKHSRVPTYFETDIYYYYIIPITIILFIFFFGFVIKRYLWNGWRFTLELFAELSKVMHKHITKLMFVMIFFLCKIFVGILIPLEINDTHLWKWYDKLLGIILIFWELFSSIFWIRMLVSSAVYCEVTEMRTFRRSFFLSIKQLSTAYTFGLNYPFILLFCLFTKKEIYGCESNYKKFEKKINNAIFHMSHFILDDSATKYNNFAPIYSSINQKKYYQSIILSNHIYNIKIKNLINKITVFQLLIPSLVPITLLITEFVLLNPKYTNYNLICNFVIFSFFYLFIEIFSFGILSFVYLYAINPEKLMDCNEKIYDILKNSEKKKQTREKNIITNETLYDKDDIQV
ncbi:hypothetical protein TCON_2596 [Astathelohania contejeani]|uniref:Uncharacterized protein n=1 Tax=Astathelohania contejeani TaxID=164912 RepID=A0ABQ7HVK1_9MICR|nr:hypothetical protein TCON_2596 [Thelohania contejeani]